MNGGLQRFSSSVRSQGSRIDIADGVMGAEGGPKGSWSDREGGDITVALAHTCTTC